ncbi:DUF7266 family protein [Halomarina pelagica]|uniref:DUF7266 family protein n=1 Tax=Halomarina pelagica TaxID=2961599 RepID=UPI0020C53D50|nr:hypothetical protein [Halomarina sp. BND7]
MSGDGSGQGTALAPDRRGVSTAVGYVLNLGLATVLITGLVFAAGTHVEQERETVIRSELVVVGEGIVADVGAADRLVQGGAEEVRIRRTIPERVAGAPYAVRVETTGGEDYLVLSTRDPSVEVRFELVVETPVSGVASGGGVVVEYVDTGDADADGDALEVRGG